MTKHFAIFDRYAGLLQWTCETESAEAALADFDSAVGIDPTGNGLAAIMDEYRVVEVTAEQRDAVEAWMDAGAPANKCPLDTDASFWKCGLAAEYEEPV